MKALITALLLTFTASFAVADWQTGEDVLEKRAEQTPADRAKGPFNYYGGDIYHGRGQGGNQY